MNLTKPWRIWPVDALEPALALHPYARVQVLWQPPETVRIIVPVSIRKATTYLLLEGENGDTASLASYDRNFDVVWTGMDRDQWNLTGALRRAHSHPLVRADAERHPRQGWEEDAIRIGPQDKMEADREWLDAPLESGNAIEP